MKATLVKLCWPILKFFETESAPTNYKPSHRVILIVVGAMFVSLSIASGVFTISGGMLGGLIPVIVFFTIGLVAIVVGALGSDNAVSKIWGTK